jgi:hypothetical protein
MGGKMSQRFEKRKREAIITQRLERAIRASRATDIEQQRIKEQRIKEMGDRAFEHHYRDANPPLTDDDKHPADDKGWKDD